MRSIKSPKKKGSIPLRLIRQVVRKAPPTRVRLKGVVVALVALVAAAVPVLAQTYTADVTVIENAGNDYTMIGLQTPVNIVNLITQNLIPSAFMAPMVNSR